MNEKFVLFGFLLWSIETTDAAVAAAPQQPYGICVDVTLCQQPPYHVICSKGLPLCPSPTAAATNQPTTTQRLPASTAVIVTSPAVTKTTVASAPTAAPSKTIVPSKPTTIVKSTKIVTPGKEINVLTIQNNFKINFGKKSNVTQEGRL